MFAMLSEWQIECFPLALVFGSKLKAGNKLIV